MTTAIKTKDLRRFAAVGFPADVRAVDHVSSTELCRSVRRTLAHPTARLVQAAGMALLELAERNDLDLFKSLPSASDTVKRRLGFVAERVAKHDRVSPLDARRLRKFTRRMKRKVETKHSPVALSGTSKPWQLDVLQEQSTPLNDKWGVYGDLDLDKFGSKSFP